jgi:CheY-like chemotaxis protein
MHDIDGKVRIVIVEPEPAIAWTLQEILNVNGYNAKAFTDPIQGLEFVLADGPEIVITAVVMPELTGIELAILVKKSWPDCRILLCSGSPEAADLNEIAQADGYQFEIIPKPIWPEALLDKISEVISGPLAARGA